MKDLLAAIANQARYATWKIETRSPMTQLQWASLPAVRLS